MTLSDLKTGDEAYIVKVKGHGGFRKRIVEMGFIKGQRVDVLQCAPLQDPVKYTSSPLRVHERPGHRNTFFAVCCEIVDAPILRFSGCFIFRMAACSMALKSKP